MWQRGPALGHDKHLSVLAPPARPANPSAAGHKSQPVHRTPQSACVFQLSEWLVCEGAQDGRRQGQKRQRQSLLVSDLSNNSPASTNAGAPSPPFFSSSPLFSPPLSSWHPFRPQSPFPGPPACFLSELRHCLGWFPIPELQAVLTS